MSPYRLLPKDWKREFSALLRGARQNVVLCSPFVSREGSDFVKDCLSGEMRTSGRLHFLTNLSPLNVCQGSTDPDALRNLAEAVTASTVTHLPRLHAKVYIADDDAAIITSGNLTSGGLARNQEYGILVTETAAVRVIREDIEGLGRLGAAIELAQLLAYCDVADSVRQAFQQQLSSARRDARQQFAHSLREAEDELIRLRLQRSSPTKTFEDTILYLLRSQGPLSTRELQPQIQSLHPDLCDDSVDRVIAGHHFGRKWKHMVRTAQAHLKERSLVKLSLGKWTLS